MAATTASTATFSTNQPVPIETLHMKMPANQRANVDLKKTKFKLEPIKVLEPTSKKIVIPEAQRVIYILDSLIRKIEIMDYIVLIVNNEDKMAYLLRSNLNDDERKNKLDEVFAHMCKYHKELVDKYNNGDYATENESSFDEQINSSRTMLGQTKESLQGLIKNSCKDILRMFHLKPTLFEAIKNEFAKVKPKNPQVIEILGNFGALIYRN
jgi:hypothetical protein